jgi:hypothetical protein
MRGGGVIVLLGLTALAAYSLGRQYAPAGKPPIAPTVSASQSRFAKPVASASPESSAPTTAAKPATSQQPPTLASTSLPAKPYQNARPDTKRKVEVALTAAAMAS